VVQDILLLNHQIAWEQYQVHKNETRFELTKKPVIVTGFFYGNK